MVRDEKNPEKVSRRGFLKGVGALIATSSIPVIASGCDTAPAPLNPGISPTQQIPTHLQYPEVPAAPLTPPQPGVLRYFTPHEARTVEALTARLLPGSPEDPGAREAGVVNYVDNLLAFGEGYAEKVYREPPYAETYTGEAPPEGNTYQVVWVASDQIERYGYQSVLTPREVYRIGLKAVDQYAMSKHGKKVVDLSETEQDGIIQDLLDNTADTFDQFSSETFFHVLRRHTCEGMFSDPAYGGNQNMVGWLLVGYPGAQRAYTPDDILNERFTRKPQSLAELDHFHPGQHAGSHVILPVSGSDLMSQDPDERSQNRP